MPPKGEFANSKPKKKSSSSWLFRFAAVPVVFAVVCYSLNIKWQLALNASLFIMLKTVHEIVPTLNSEPISAAAKAGATFCNLSPFHFRLPTPEASIMVQRSLYFILENGLPTEDGCSYEEEVIDGIPNYWIRPEDPQVERKEGFIMYAHGGGWILGKFGFYKKFLCKWSKRSGLPVVYVDYPLAPDNGVTAKTQLQALWKVLKVIGPRASKNIVLAGDSAGGHLSLLLGQQISTVDPVLRQKVAALALISPVSDMSRQGDSWETNKGKDILLSYDGFFFLADNAAGVKSDMSNLKVLPKKNLEDPGLNPTSPRSIFQGLPPVRVIAGGNEFLRSDAELVHKKVQEAGGDSKLTIGPYMQHIYIVADGILPEATEGAKAYEESVNQLLS
jgi:monoterpene epsilon-lactone hydrolase